MSERRRGLYITIPGGGEFFLLILCFNCCQGGTAGFWFCCTFLARIVGELAFGV